MNTVTVCDSCWCASCHQGAHPCEESEKSKAVEKPVELLKALDQEHEHFWD